MNLVAGHKVDVSNDPASYGETAWLPAPPADPRFWTETELAEREHIRSVYPTVTDEQI